MSLLKGGYRGGGEVFTESFMKTYLNLFCQYLELYMIPENSDEKKEKVRVETIAAQLADIDLNLLNRSSSDTDNTIAPEIRANMFNEFLRMQPDNSLASSAADEKFPETYLDKSNFLIHKNIMTTKKGEVSYFNEKITPILKFFDTKCTSAVSKEDCLQKIDEFVLYKNMQFDEKNETQPKMILFLITLRIIIVYNRRILRYKMRDTLQKCSKAVINCYSSLNLSSKYPKKEEFSKLFFELSSLYDNSYVSMNEYKVGFIIPTTNKKWLIDFMVVFGSVGISVGTTAIGSCFLTPVGGVVAGAIATAGCAAFRNTMVNKFENKRNEQLLDGIVKPYLKKFANDTSKKCATDVFETCIQWINEYKNEAFENFDKYIYLYEILFLQYRTSFPNTDCLNTIEMNKSTLETPSETPTVIPTETSTVTPEVTLRSSERIAAKNQTNQTNNKVGGKKLTKYTKKGGKHNKKTSKKRTRKTRR